MAPLNLNDLIFISILLVGVPLLVNFYTSGPQFSNQFRKLAILFGMIFVSSGLGLNDLIMSVLGASRADDMYHDWLALDIAHRINAGDWDYIWEYATPGNRTFQVFIGFIYFLTGVGKCSAESLNGFLGFWANLMLARHFTTALSSSAIIPKWFVLMVFSPSSFFWTTFLYKEALMYWSICLFYTSAIPASPNGRLRVGIPSVIGLAVGLLMRPYAIIAWAMSVGLSTVIFSRRLVPMILSILIMVVAIGFLANQINVEELSEARDFADKWGESYAKYSGEAGFDSNIQGTPIFFVSGSISLFFRPFLWNLRAGRVLINAIEIWTVTCMIVVGWFSLNAQDRGSLLWQGGTMVSILTCLAFGVLFTYMLNEGQIARMRLQVMPALLTLAWLPQAIRINNRMANFSREFLSPVPVGFTSAQFSDTPYYPPDPVSSVSPPVKRESVFRR